MNLPKDFETRMKNMLGSEYEDFKKSFLSEQTSHAMRINPEKENAADLIFKEFGDLEKVSWCENGFYVDKSAISGLHPYHMAGLFYFQEASAMCAVSALPINEGDFVLDLCAAPGGKTTQAAAKLKGSGLLVANEITKNRAMILSENVERMGLKNTVVTNETPQNLSQKYPEFFDKIIVDAPCSGEGMFRKEPKAITEWSLEHTYSCAKRQQHILESAVSMLKPGGMLVYSTCTFAPEENEHNIEFLLKNYPELSLAQIPELSMLKDGAIPLTKRIYPHLAKGEGHFAALLKKSGNLIAKMQTQKSNVSKENLSLIENFFSQFLNIHIPHSCLVSFGERIYALPYGINIDKIKVIRPGLYLGDLKKGRFEPSHHLCLSLCAKDFKNSIDFSPDSQELISYLKGNTIPCTLSGWVCVLVSGVPIGLGKASGGVLKNHYPKNLRLTH